MNEHIDYTPDGKGFYLYADDGTVYTVPRFEDVYDKEKFLDLMKKGGKAREWISKHDDFGLYVKKRDRNGRKLSDNDARLQARGRYMGDESWYDEDNYFWVVTEEFQDPLICQLRISNHNTSHEQYESSHLNDTTVDCQTCLNIIIGDKAYNRNKPTTAQGKYAIISIEAFFDEPKRTKEQIAFFEDFISKVRSGSQPHITMDEIRTYIDPNAKIVASQNGYFISPSEANIKPNQFDITRKNRVIDRLKPRAWNKPKVDPNSDIPKEIRLSDAMEGATNEKYQDKDGEYEIFIYNNRRFGLDYPNHVAYFFKKNGNLSKANPIPILDENKRKKYNILREDKNMRILVKTNKGLRPLGEGKIYSKKELSLNEDVTGRVYTKKQLKLSEAWTNGKVALTLNPNGQDITPSSVQTSAQNMLNNVPQATAVTLQADDVDGVTAPTFSPEDPRNDTVQNISAKKATSSAVQNAAKNGGTINITKDDPQQGSMGESKKGSDKLIEMRRNSIPFSKTELSKFLRSL